MKITFDNGEEYTEEKFKKDKARMFDTIRWKESNHFGECNCSDCKCCKCPLDDGDICICSFYDSFQVIERVHKWAKEHPFVTNRDKLKELFGTKIVNSLYIYGEVRSEDVSFSDWLDQEYKKPGPYKEELK